MVAPKSTPTTAGITSGSTLVLIRPSGVTEGDVMIAFIRSQSTGTSDLTPPSGWSRVGVAFDGGASGGRITGAWAKVATGSEPSSYSFTVPSRAVGGISVWSKDDVSDSVVATCIDYRGWWDTSAPGRRMDEYVATGDALLFLIAATEAVEGVPHVPLSTPGGYTTLLNAQTGSGTTGSRTALWVGYKTQVGPVPPETEVLVDSEVVVWDGSPAGEVLQGFGIQWLSAPETPLAGSPFKTWDGAQYVDLDAYVWDGADYIPVLAH